MNDHMTEREERMSGARDGVFRNFMTRRHLEKRVELPSLKTKAGHESGAGDADSQQEGNNLWNLTKQVAFFALAELAGTRQPCVREFLRASQHRVNSLITVSNKGQRKG